MKPDQKGTGQSVIKPDFANAAYGTSSMIDVKPEAETAAPTKRGKAAAPAVASALTANAVRVRGFWRENTKSQNVVSELLKNLKEKSSNSNFNFTVKGPKGEEKLNDDQIMDITVTGKPGELGLPFEVTLPLSHEVVVK
jgi:type IV pilus assembly protein PilM